MHWPDDVNNAKRPRYSAETGSKLLVNQHLDLENTRNELVKVSEQLQLVTQDRDETTIKLRDETSRLTALEELLRHRMEELTQEKLSRANLESELEVASAKYKEVDKERKGIQQQFEDFVSRQDAGDQKSKITNLERKIRSLQAENAALSTPAERPSSRTSSIPLPKSRRPRSSSENKIPRTEEDLKTCRTELAETKERLKKVEARMRQADEAAIRLENEKTAADRKAQATKAQLENSLQEAKEEIEMLQMEIQSSSGKGASATEFNELSKAYAGSQEQLQAAIADKADLERRLARKTTQCETLQEKLEGCMFPTSDDEALRQQLVDAQEEASRSKRQLAALKKEMENLADRRDSLLRTRYKLQDRDLQLQSLEEELRRRDSATAALEDQEERTLRFFNEREAAKDNLAKSEARSRYFECQLQFRQQELTHAQSQVKDLELALTKSRTFNAQQQELYKEAIKSCTLAETQAAEVERELLALRDEMANRSTCEEAAERNRQWALALKRVSELERALDPEGDPSTPKASVISLPPIATFGDQSDMDVVASLFVTLQRIREERETLRGSVEFLSFELRAKENAVEQRLESQRASSQLLLQSAEEDVAQLRRDLTSCEARLLQSHEDSLRALEECNVRLYRTQAISAAAFVALQHTNAQKESEGQSWLAKVVQLESMLEDERQAAGKAHSLQSELDQRDRTITDVNGRYAEATRTLRETTRELRKLQERLNDLDEARTKLEGTLEEESTRCRELELDQASQVLAYKRLEETHQILREELYEARTEADQLRNNHMTDLAGESPDAQSVLQGHVEELEARVFRRNEQIGTQQNDIRRLDMNLRIAENAVEEMRLELGELRAQNVSLEDDASTVRLERNQAEKELDLARADLDTLRLSVDKRENLLRQNEEAREQEIAILVEVVSTHSLEVRKITRELEKAQAQISELQDNVEKTPDSVPESHLEELAKLKQTIVDIEAQHEQDSSLLDEYSRRVEALERALQEATDRGDALAQQLPRATQLARDEVNAHMSTLEDKIDTLSAEVEELEERLAEDQQNIQIVLKQNGELENQVTDLEENASAKTREHHEKVEELTTKIQALEGRLDGLRATNEIERAALSEELETLRQEHSATLLVVKEVDELRARAQTLQADSQLLATQLSQVSSDLQVRTAENSDLQRRLAEIGELKAIIQRQDIDLHSAQLSRAQAERDLSAVQANLVTLRIHMDEKNAAQEKCRAELAQALLQIEILPQLRLHVSALEAAAVKMKEELYEAQQAASAAASTTVREADANMRTVQLETMLATIREDNEELERVLALKSKEIDDYDDRHIELLKERKKLVAKVDSLTRKIRNMQRQLDALTGVANVDLAPSELELGTSAGSSTHGSTPVGRPALCSLSTGEMRQVRPRSSLENGSASVLLPVTSTGSKKSVNSSPPTSTEYPNSTPKPLSSSAPPAPLAVAAPSSTLNFMPISASLPSQVLHTPQPRADTTPSAQTSSSRKRRLPEDFDPSPEEQLPAMPVLSTTPARLRKALREGPLSRTGFTPSRSRKSSATAPDKELANVAAAAVASLNLAGTFKPEPFSLSLLSSKPRPAAPTRSALPADLDVAPSKAKPVSDITNTPKVNRPPSSSSLYAGSTLKVETAAPAPKYRGGGWLSGASKTSASSRGTGASQTTSSAPSRRHSRPLVSSPKLGSGVMPKRPYDGFKAFPRDLS